MRPDPSQLDAALKLMAPIVSHEIRNPMAVIKNSAYFIKTKLERLDQSDPKIERHLGIIESEIQHANDVLEEILRYARMKEPSPKELTVKSLLDAALGTLEIPEGVKLSKKVPESLSVTIDPDLGTTAVLHVLRNALEAAALAKNPGKVSVEASADGKKQVLLAVTDNGPGIPEAERERLFSPFHTTKPRGCGLGLAFTRKVLELHGGTAAAPEAATGACFELRFPAA